MLGFDLCVDPPLSTGSQNSKTHNPKMGVGVGLDGYSGIQLSCSQINQLHFGLKHYSNHTNMSLEDPVDS